MITLILGGARSGKSRYAESLAKRYDQVLYVATATIGDEDMAERVKKHRENRPSHWRTLERYRGFQDPPEEPCILLDCMTFMLTNILFEEENEDYSAKRMQQIEPVVFQEIKQMLEVYKNKHLILVSNEVGLGIAPSYPLGGAFRDMQGRVNQYLAREADEVFFMISGLPMTLKEPS